MIKVLGKKVLDLNCNVPESTARGAAIGCTVMLEGDKVHRWVPFSMVSWESVDF